MSEVPSPESVGRAVLERLGVAEDPMTGADPVSFLRSLGAAGVALVKNPAGTAAANGRMAIGLAAAVRAAAGRAVGSEASGPVAPAVGDKRFIDPAYEDNPLFFLLAQDYLLSGQLVSELTAQQVVLGQQEEQRVVLVCRVDETLVADRGSHRAGRLATHGPSRRRSYRSGEADSHPAVRSRSPRRVLHQRDTRSTQ